MIVSEGAFIVFFYFAYSHWGMSSNFTNLNTKHQRFHFFGQNAFFALSPFHSSLCVEYAFQTHWWWTWPCDLFWSMEFEQKSNLLGAHWGFRRHTALCLFFLQLIASNCGTRRHIKPYWDQLWHKDELSLVQSLTQSIGLETTNKGQQAVAKHISREELCLSLCKAN
jgi:hypothetical protein